MFDFFDRGAEDEHTLQSNRRAFERLRLVQPVLNDVRSPDLRTTIVGGAAAAPIVITPTGAIGAGWPHADLAIARDEARSCGAGSMCCETRTSSGI